MILASLIMPVFNSELYIEECLKSIVDQTFNNFELIIIDDNSTDNSLNIINKFASIDQRIIVIRNEINKGVSNSRNIGIKESKGEFLFFIDSDDVLKCNYLEKMIDEQIKNKNKLVISSFQYIDEENVLGKKKINQIEKKGGIKTLLFENGYLWNKCFERNIIQDNNLSMEDYTIREDLLFVIKYSKFTNGYLLLTDILYFYRKHNASSSHKISDNVFDSYYVSKKLQYLSDDDKNFVRIVTAELKSTMSIYLLKLKNSGDKKRFLKLWKIYQRESYLTLQEFNKLPKKRKIWYLFFLMNLPMLKKYYRKLEK